RMTTDRATGPARLARAGRARPGRRSKPASSGQAESLRRSSQGWWLWWECWCAGGCSGSRCSPPGPMVRMGTCTPRPWYFSPRLPRWSPPPWCTLLLLSTPRPLTFFAWIIGLATVLAVLVPFSTAAPLTAKAATAVVDLVLGIAIGSLISGVAARSVRVPPGTDAGYLGGNGPMLDERPSARGLS